MTATWWRTLAPPPDLTVSQWADARRRLSPEASAEPGRWDTRRAEYQRGIMDAISDATVHTVVVMSSAQVGKSEIVLNGLGYFIDQDPAPILLLQPTVEMGEAFSKDRLAPMLRDTPALQGKVKDAASRNSGNTTLHKQFPGGHVTIAGANSPASLASRPIRVLFCDEVDRYPASAGTEGDPVALATKRTTTFWNRKVVMVSTPTVKGSSRIERAYLESDQRVRLAVCQHCGHEQKLVWANVKWPEGKPSEARYCCDGCGVLWDDVDRMRAVRAGRWMALAPFNGVAGFHLSELYSPWRTMAETASDFLAAKASPERLQTWVNTSLGETWEDKSGALDDGALIQRREEWGLEWVPADVLLITAGADVQHDRIEVTFLGWSEGGSIFALGHDVLYGDVIEDDEVWRDLDACLARRFPHALGGRIGVDAAAVDAGDGATSKKVMEFCRARARRRIMAIKGEDGFRRAVMERSKGKTSAGLWLVGVDTAKNTLMTRISALPERSPGEQPYAGSPVRFSADLPPVWFEQLVSERIVTGHVRGMPTRRFERIPGRRAEALDCTVYAYAARQVVTGIDWQARAVDLSRSGEEIAPPQKMAVRPRQFGAPGAAW